MTPIMLFFSCNKVKANRQQATAFSMFDEIRWWILVNLITNAYETMKTMSQNKKIEVGSSSRNNSVIVTISDSRPGQVLDLRNKMFNPSHTNKDGSPVTGLNIAES